MLFRHAPLDELPVVAKEILAGAHDGFHFGDGKFEVGELGGMNDAIPDFEGAMQLVPAGIRQVRERRFGQEIGKQSVDGIDALVAAEVAFAGFLLEEGVQRFVESLAEVDGDVAHRPGNAVDERAKTADNGAAGRGAVSFGEDAVERVAEIFLESVTKGGGGVEAGVELFEIGRDERVQAAFDFFAGGGVHGRKGNYKVEK